MKTEEDPTIALHVDRLVPMEEVVKVMNIAKDNKYKLILATQPLKSN
jgi:biopolymer transport protein ExbD